MPRRTGFLDLGQIQMDRWPMNPKTLGLVDYLRSSPNNGVPPIKVQHLPNGSFRIKDGRHRVLAFKLLGRSRIEAKWGERVKGLGYVVDLEAKGTTGSLEGQDLPEGPLANQVWWATSSHEQDPGEEGEA